LVLLERLLSKERERRMSIVTIRAWVRQQSWAGLTETPALVIRECPKRCKVRWVDANFQRPVGSISYVPYEAVRLDQRDAYMSSRAGDYYQLCSGAPKS
jgi:hypothetical protein